MGAECEASVRVRCRSARACPRRRPCARSQGWSSRGTAVSAGWRSPAGRASGERRTPGAPRQVVPAPPRGCRARDVEEAEVVGRGAQAMRSSARSSAEPVAAAEVDDRQGELALGVVMVMVILRGRGQWELLGSLQGDADARGVACAAVQQGAANGRGSTARVGAKRRRAGGAGDGSSGGTTAAPRHIRAA